MTTLLQKKQIKGISLTEQKILDDRKHLAQQLKQAAELHLKAANKLAEAAERIEKYEEHCAIHIATEAYAVVEDVRKARRLLTY
jgi:hypothetical protein